MTSPMQEDQKGAQAEWELPENKGEDPEGKDADTGM